jgi:molybdopterin-dependent oxidoreductase alpha subunit
MADDPLKSSDPLINIALGHFPNFAPRHPPRPHGEESRKAIKHACLETEERHLLAIQSQPQLEAKPAEVRRGSRSAAGLPAVLNTFKLALPAMGMRGTLRNFLNVNQKDGFDCQSCAWPSPDGKRHQFEFCENGAKAMASEGTRKQITAEFFREHSIADLASRSDAWMEQQGRLTHPLVRRRGATHYEPIEWEEAFKLIGQQLRALPTPDAATFYTSGRASNEAAFLYQLFVRNFGTNNLPDCSNMCHESSGTALVESLGIGKGTVTLEDFEHTDLIVIIGQNPGTNHPRMLTALERARHAGARIIAINPLREPGSMRFTDPNPDEYKTKLHFAAHLMGSGTELAELHLPVRINGDIALLKGLMKQLLIEEAAAPGTVIDHQFIRDYTDGYESLKADLEATSWDEVIEHSGISRDQIEHAGRMIAGARRMICTWAMGLTQHRHAVAGIQQLVNLLLLGGHMGRQGAGTCCVRGHSNVQGDRTMGVWERAHDSFLDALQQEFKFNPPRHHGHDVVDSLGAMQDGEIKVFVALGGNLLAAGPDTVFAAEAFARCDLTVQIATKLNRGHLITGQQALLLPCLGRSEKDPGGAITVEDSMGVVSPSVGIQDPTSDNLKSECAIIAGIAHEAVGSELIDWRGLAADYSRIRDHISRVIPGFERFNERLAQGPFYLPNGPRERVFPTDTGRARFITAGIPQHDIGPDQYLLMSIRSHDQFNTTIYGLNDRYRGIHGGRRVVFMHPDDIAARGWNAGLKLDIISHFEGEKRMAYEFQLVPYNIPRGNLATYYPEVNVLVPIGSVAERSNTPTYKSIVVSLQPSAALKLG